MIENLIHDLRYAARTLAKAPLFAVVIVLTMALSIGATSAIFSVIDGVLLRPLPYPEPDRIARVFLRNASFPKFPVNHWDFRDFRERNRAFDSLALYTRSDMQLSGAGEPVKLSGFRVSAGFFRVLGLSPVRGREFQTNDELPGNGRIVIVSDRVWRSKLAASPAIIGSKILLESQPFEVVGVMPPGVEHPGNTYNAVAQGDTVDIWIPFTFEGNPARRGSHFTEVVGRMKHGVTATAAASDLNALFAELAKTYAAARGWEVLVHPLHQEVVGSSRRLLLVLLGAVGLVLLLACVNAANLLLARATARQREIAVRSALGAGASRLVRQMLAESLLISAIGGAFGAVLAAGGVRWLVSLIPADFPRAAAIHLNGTVFAFTVLLAIATGLLFGLAPALQAARSDLQLALRESSRASAGARHIRLRSMLVVGEIGLACVLLIGAGLMLRSFWNLLSTDPGFRPQRVLTAQIGLPQREYPDRKSITAFFERLLSELRSIPGVEIAGAGTDLPWTGYDDNTGFNVEGRSSQQNDGNHARYHGASPDYFRALGIPLLAGRFFDDHDDPDAPPVMIINQAMARRYWPNEEPVGKRIDIGFGPSNPTWTTIVGITGDVKDRPEAASAEPAFWLASRQQPFGLGRRHLVIRAATDPATLTGTLRATVRNLNPNLAVSNVNLMDQIAGGSFATHRFSLFLVALFAVVALSLAATGIYGVISYAVSQRMQEFGMRMALGARPGDLMRLVVSQGVKLAAIGIILGLGTSLALARVLRTLLYGVGEFDPLTFAAVAVMAALTAAVACYLPARRAADADPMTALRSE